METLGGPCCGGALAAGCELVFVGVTVVLMVVVVPEEIPVWDDVLGTGWGGGTVAGAGMFEPPCGDDVAGEELGGGTCDSGG